VNISVSHSDRWYFICSMICQLHSFHQMAESSKWSMHRKQLRTAGILCSICYFVAMSGFWDL